MYPDARLSSTSADSARIDAPGMGSDRGSTQQPPLFFGILPQDFARIRAAACANEFARGEVLFVEGEAVRRVLLLTSGLVKVTKLGLSGTEVILRLSTPGDVLGAIGLVSTGLHAATTQAFRSCRALSWDASTFKSLSERYPVMYSNMVRMLSSHLMELEGRFHEVATEKVEPRVACQVMRLLKQVGRTVARGIEIGLSREELAQMTGTTLFTVSRLLSAWEARGIVEPGREVVTVRNYPALRAIAADECDSNGCSNLCTGGCT